MSIATFFPHADHPDRQPAVWLNIGEPSDEEPMTFDSTDEAYDYVTRNVETNLASVRALFAEKRDLDRRIAALEADTALLRKAARQILPHL